MNIIEKKMKPLICKWIVEKLKKEKQMLKGFENPPTLDSKEGFVIKFKGLQPNPKKEITNE